MLDELVTLKGVEAERDALRAEIGRALVERNRTREDVVLANGTIHDAAELLYEDIVEDDVAIDALVLTAIKRVLSERESARALAVRLEQEVAAERGVRAAAQHWLAALDDWSSISHRVRDVAVAQTAGQQLRAAEAALRTAVEQGG